MVYSTLRQFLAASLPTVALLTVLSMASAGDAPSRVHTLSTPIPMTAEQPIPPDQLRIRGPAVLPMMGTWRFSLAHGQTRDGLFIRPADFYSASSARGDRVAANAFDGTADTAWCAMDGLPQWLQVDLGAETEVVGVALTWESTQDQFGCRLEGSADGTSWHMLADRSSQWVGNGLWTISPVHVRFLRLTVVAGKAGRWTMLREWSTQITDATGTHAWTPHPSAEHLAQADAFARLDFDDAAWKDMEIPSNWEMAGYSMPTMGGIDDTVGLYRRWVDIPASFAGAHVVWRFDGVFDGAQVFVNGHPAGYHESGFTGWELDVSDLITPGQRNLVAMRVCKDTSSSLCDKGDFESMGGIFRETQLVAVPQTHVADIAVRTTLDAHYQDADLQADVVVAGTPGASIAVTATLMTAAGAVVQADGLSGQALLGGDGRGTARLQAHVIAPKLWSAEKPTLYYLVIAIPGERVQQRFGFRSIEVRGPVLLWNGQPIKCNGVCRHDIWATQGSALDEKSYRTEVALMKAANINAIRTSHYNQATRFMELAEETGFYLLDEVPFCWVGDKGIKDPAFLRPLMQRLEETWARDKNYPSILAWSLGNENPTGPNLAAVMNRITELDPVRLAFGSQCGIWDYKKQRVNDQHYPALQGIESAAMTTTVPAMWSEQPHIFWQPDSQELDPGVSDLWANTLAKSWEVIWREPSLLGSFIWEWQDQGVADRFPDHTREWESATGLRWNNHKGIVDSFRHPKPEWWYVKTFYSPVEIAATEIQPDHGSCTIPIGNRYRFTDLGELTCAWTALSDGTAIGNRPVVARGTTTVACPPCGQVLASFPAPPGLTALRVEFTHADGRSVISAILPVHGAPRPRPPAPSAPGTVLTHVATAESDTIANDITTVVFDHGTGHLRSWSVRGHVLLASGPTMTFGESKHGDEKLGFIESAKPPTMGTGSITIAKHWGSMCATTIHEVHCGAKDQYRGFLTCAYDVRADATIGVRWCLIWDTADAQAWDLGLTWPVPPTFTTMTWSRLSAFAADYPAGHIGAPQGTCDQRDVCFRASKRDLDWMSVSDGTLGLTVLADGTPLVGRCTIAAGGTRLILSRDVSGPRDFSGSYVADHDIHLVRDGSYSGRFILEATTMAHTAPATPDVGHP